MELLQIIWDWLSDDANRGRVAVLATLCFGTAGGLWAFYRHLRSARRADAGVALENMQDVVKETARGWERLADDQRAKIEALEKRLGVGERAVRAFFRVLEEAHVPAEDWEARLTAIAENFKRTLAQTEPAAGDAPEVAALKASAREALEAGELDDADAFLAQVQAAEDAEIDRRRLEAAATRAQRGDLAMTRLRYKDAAPHFAEAAERTPVNEEATALDYLDREARALYRQGEEFGDNGALADAISRYRALLERRPRDRVPRDWAMTQNNLGTALRDLGERESGTARLEEGVAAYRAALEEWTRERVPLRWAGTQINLGAALRALGERESGTARLEEAVAAYRAALEEWTRDRVPLQWAMTQNNLGSALVTFGERESGTARLDEAVAAYRSALEEYTRDRVPLQWAMTQNNLGNALQTRGERESGTARLEEALAAYRSALEERTRDRVPLQWAMTQNNLGNALRALGARESGSARLEEAVAAYRAALDVFEAGGADHYAQGARDNLARAEALLAERRGG